MVQQNTRIEVEDVWVKFEDRFQDWFKEYVSVTTCTRKYLYSFEVMTASLTISFNDGLVGFALQYQQ